MRRRFWRPDVAADVDDELAFHVEQRVADLVAAGWSAEAARAEATRRVGDLAALTRTCVAIDEARESTWRRREWLGGLAGDVRLAVRQLARAPLVTLAAVVTLALGIGANSAIFGVVYAVLLRPLPYADAERIVVVVETQRGARSGVGPGQYTEWARRSRAFETIAALSPGTFNLTEGPAGDGAARVVGAFVTPSLFRTLAAPAALGRYFGPGEAVPGRDGVVVLSDALFRERFGGDSAVVGRTIHLNGAPYVVLGVAPPGYSMHPDGEQLWVPLALTAEYAGRFDEHWLAVYAKLRRGVSVDAAGRDMARISRELATLHPAAMVDRSARVLDFRADLAGDYRAQLVALSGAVGLILLLACLNVAGLLLAQLGARRTEMAIRAALGAGRWRVARQLLTESLTLAAAGGIAALFVAQVAARGLVVLAPSGVPRLDGAAATGAALRFAAVPTLLGGLLLGILPALRAARGAAPAVLREGGRGAAAGPRDGARHALVVGEIALALALLAGAGLLVRSARNLDRVALGFDATRLATARVTLAGGRYDTPERVVAGVDRLLDALRALPNVSAAAATTIPPLGGGGPDIGIRAEGRQYAPGSEPSAFVRSVSPNYFEAMGIPLAEGRGFTAADGAGAPGVVVVSEALARLLWPGERAVGRRVACRDVRGAEGWCEVVGVARGVRHYLARPPLAELYVPYPQAPGPTWSWFGNSITLTVRAARGGPPPDVRAAVAAVDPALPVYEARTYDDLRRRSTAENRFAMLLFSGFALLGLVLAAVGVYGVLASVVGQRTPEIAVRLAIGATRRDVVALVLRQGARLAGAGIAIGLLLAAVASRALASLLYGVAPIDPLTYAVVAAGLGAVALLACWMPARRATAVDPQSALRGG